MTNCSIGRFCLVRRNAHQKPGGHFLTLLPWGRQSLSRFVQDDEPAVISLDNPIILRLEIPFTWSSQIAFR